jgi:hypothetical protein
LYRRFAAEARGAPRLCALWTELAREEEVHARSLAALVDRLRPIEIQHIRLEGWSDALDEVDKRLTIAEKLPPGAPLERQLVAALDLERTELEAARYALLVASGFTADEEPQVGHAARLASAAASLSSDPDVRLAAALLRARSFLRDHARATA